MTVAELIEELQACSPESNVYIFIRDKLDTPMRELEEIRADNSQRKYVLLNAGRPA